MFLCGNCCRKKNLPLSDRLVMSAQVYYGDNPCSECSRVVVSKDKLYLRPVKRQAKPVPRDNGTVQIGLFAGFNSFNQ